MLAIKSDPELNKLLGNADFAQAGVPQCIHPNLVHKAGKKGKKGKDMDDEIDGMTSQAV